MRRGFFGCKWKNDEIIYDFRDRGDSDGGGRGCGRRIRGPVHPQLSYDPTRELYKAINAAFIEDWKAKTGETATLKPRMAVREHRRGR